MANKLFLISGPSGSGKTTIMREVMQNEVVSFTTRAKREGEVDGRDYNFISMQDFDVMRGAGDLVETSTYGGNHYGIARNELLKKTGAGPAFAIVDYPGMKALWKAYNPVVGIFIYTSYAECFDNMTSRGASEGFIRKRLSTFLQEVDNRKAYDYVIRNNRGKLEDAVEIVRHIIHSEVQ